MSSKIEAGGGIGGQDLKQVRWAETILEGEFLIEKLRDLLVALQTAPQRNSFSGIIESVMSKLKFDAALLRNFKERGASSLGDQDFEYLDRWMIVLRKLVEDIEIFLQRLPEISAENSEISLITSRIQKLSELLGDLEKSEISRDDVKYKRISEDLDEAINELVEVYRISSANNFEELYDAIRSVKKLKLCDIHGVYGNEDIIDEIENIRNATKSTRVNFLNHPFIKTLGYTLRIKIKELLLQIMNRK